ncbi:MAG: hypothetical protein ABI409_07155 [Ramlibacter sp.]
MIDVAVEVSPEVDAVAASAPPPPPQPVTPRRATLQKSKVSPRAFLVSATSYLILNRGRILSSETPLTTVTA